jgi:uncharacterized protein YmfQ (DUF2313 family)
MSDSTGSSLRSLTDVWTGLIGLLPRGWVWWRSQASNVGRSLYPLADAIATLEADAESMQDEIDPRTASQLLPDYERVLGPDPAAMPSSSDPSLTQRRQTAFRRWTMSPGGQSAAYFIALCATMGVTITIDEFAPMAAGGFVAGAAVISSAQSRIWRVNLPATQVIPFRAGGSAAGNSIGAIVPIGVEAMLRLYGPADCLVVFNYTGGA